MAQKPSIPKGTRDFSPAEVAKRNHIIQTIKKHFETFGFQPIETPSFENSETLMGKYGDEGDRLIFKILNSGDFLENAKSKFEQNHDVEIYELLLKAHENIVQGLFHKYLNELGLRNNFESIIREFDYTARELNGVQLEFVIQSILKRKEQIIKRCLKVLNNPNFVVEKHSLRHFIEQERRNYVRLVSKNIAKELFDNLLETNESTLISKEVSEKALRYDLTVPFARYVVMHRNEIDLPFKRYQIQPVWRADRPQKGRFREFYQCDADVVGADSLLQEVEFVQLYDAVFTDLGLKGTTIKINNRKILSGIVEVIGEERLFFDFLVALDKLDKIGRDAVKLEMLQRGISQESIDKASPIFNLTGKSRDVFFILEEMLQTSEVGMKGIKELREIFDTIKKIPLQSAKLELDITLARGLNYYTGAIFEVAAPEGVQMGSIGGGGRYDDLTGIFGLKDVSGVGISFGLDRIYLVLEELGLFPENIETSLDVLCLNFGKNEGFAALKLITELRKAGLRADLYPTDAKMQKQFKYADKRGVPYVILLGEKELLEGNFVVKKMKTGDQQAFGLDAVHQFAEAVKSDF